MTNKIDYSKRVYHIHKVIITTIAILLSICCVVGVVMCVSSIIIEDITSVPLREGSEHIDYYQVNIAGLFWPELILSIIICILACSILLLTIWCIRAWLIGEPCFSIDEDINYTNNGGKKKCHQ